MYAEAVEALSCVPHETVMGMLYPFPEGILLLKELLEAQIVVEHPDFMTDEDRDAETSPKDWPDALKKADPVLGFKTAIENIVKLRAL